MCCCRDGTVFNLFTLKDPINKVSILFQTGNAVGMSSGDQPIDHRPPCSFPSICTLAMSTTVSVDMKVLIEDLLSAKEVLQKWRPPSKSKSGFGYIVLNDQQRVAILYALAGESGAKKDPLRDGLFDNYIPRSGITMTEAIAKDTVTYIDRFLNKQAP